MMIYKLSLRTKQQQVELKKFSGGAVALIVTHEFQAIDKCSSIRDAMREAKQMNRTGLAIVDMLA